jgi:hypothetical protein
MDVAAKSGKVGRDVLVTAIPRLAADMKGILVTGSGMPGMPSSTFPMFFDWPAGRTNGLQTSPLFAYPGGVMDPVTVSSRMPERALDEWGDRQEEVKAGAHVQACEQGQTERKSLV